MPPPPPETLDPAPAADPAAARAAGAGWAGRWAAWWLDDLPPLGGRLRFVFYAGLLVLTQFHRKSPLSGLAIYRRTAPELYNTHGLYDWLGGTYLPPEVMELVVRSVTVAWICAAIGLCTRVSAVLTAAGVVFLHAHFHSSNALNHAWYAPMFALVVLCFTRSRDRWSVDHYLRRLRARPAPPLSPPVSPPVSRPSLADTGWARKMVLVYLVGFYFSAGLSKLLDGGFAWMDGRTLQFFLEDRDRAATGILASRLWLCSLASFLAIVFEVGSPVALIWRRARLPVVATWILMHEGIRLSLGPWYLTNYWCMLLVVDWTAIARRVRAWLPGAPARTRGEPPAARAPAPATAGRRSPTEVAAVAAGTALLGLVTAAAVLQIEYWPVTTVDMYAAYHGQGLRAGIPREEYRDAAAAQALARRYLEGDIASRHVAMRIAGRVYLRLVGSGVEPLKLERGVGVLNEKQWNIEVLKPAVLPDLAAKPPGRLEHDPEHPEYAAAALLRRLAPVIRGRLPGWEAYDRAELVYRLADTEVVIAASDLRGP